MRGGGGNEESRQKRDECGTCPAFRGGQDLAERGKCRMGWDRVGLWSPCALSAAFPISLRAVRAGSWLPFPVFAGILILAV